MYLEKKFISKKRQAKMPSNDVQQINANQNLPSKKSLAKMPVKKCDAKINQQLNAKQRRVKQKCQAKLLSKT